MFVTEVSERPILFGGSLVLAIIEGRKIQTRRVIKPQPEPQELGCIVTPKCRYGGPGDRLYVRETFAIETYPIDNPDFVYRADRCASWMDGDALVGDPFYLPSDWEPTGKWKPSIYMPKWASRIDLLVTGIRVERVQDISWQDAIAEGVVPVSCPCCFRAVNGCTDCMDTGFAENPVDEFSMLWDSINSKRGFSWESNPWVWVVDFERIERPQGVGIAP